MLADTLANSVLEAAALVKSSGRERFSESNPEVKTADSCATITLRVSKPKHVPWRGAV